MNSPRLILFAPAASSNWRRRAGRGDSYLRNTPLLSSAVSPLPATAPTKILSRLVRTRFIKERPKEGELAAKGYDHAPRRAVVKNNHVWLVRDGAGHEPLRAFARAQLSPSRRVFDDNQKIEPVSEKSSAAPITPPPPHHQGLTAIRPASRRISSIWISWSLSPLMIPYLPPGSGW